MLRIGYITEIDASKCYARVTFMDDDIVSDWLQICVMGALGNKFFHMFDVNEQVACLMDNHSDDGIIIGALYNDKTLAGGDVNVTRVQFSDDSFIEYNRNTHEYNINVQGKVNITAASEVNITSPVVNITSPNVSVTGNITATGTVSAAALSAPSIGGSGVTMSGGNLEAAGELKGATVKAGPIDLGTHTHSGVTTGGGTSGPPTP